MAGTSVGEARGLTLHEITDELGELVEARESATTDEEARACDEAIALYLDELTGKVDRIIGYVVYMESAAEAAKVEADRLKKLAETRMNRAKRIKAHVLDVMKLKGYKKLEGNLGRLRVQANGGLAPLELEEHTVPNKFCLYKVEIPGAWWDVVWRSLNRLGVSYKKERCPDTGEIRNVLAANGIVPGAKFGERGEHLRVE